MQEQLVILFWKLDIENSSSCSFDFVTISTSTTKYVKLCGMLSNYTSSPAYCIRTNSTSVTINFISDISVQSTGFGIEYFAEGNSSSFYTCGEYYYLVDTTPPSKFFIHNPIVFYLNVKIM